jgi:nuclear GTP-binding protein
MVKLPNRQSKRTTIARRYNIAKKAKESERKNKRDAKKNPRLRKKLGKDPGIPNLHPFKAQMLKKLEEQKRLLKFIEVSNSRKAQELSQRKRLGGDTSLAGLVADAQARGASYSGTVADVLVSEKEKSSSSNRAGEQTRRAFFRQVKEVLEKSDVILEVLDARDPLSCRALAIEALALTFSPPKKIILVLNKVDLVPPFVVTAWLSYLRNEFPTIAFKASTQHQKDNLAAIGGGVVNKQLEEGVVLSGSGASGTDTLMQLLKNYSRSKDGLKTHVTVGVIGYPNVGKSSLINSLKRSKAVGVSPQPGFTKSLSEIQIDSKITLIDCPGVIFEDGDSSGKQGANDYGASLVLRNCISVSNIDDPESALDSIISRCAPEKLMVHYNIPYYNNTTEFLNLIAKVRGKIQKGGIPDRPSAAKSVLQDWMSGEIPFFVLPPNDYSIENKEILTSSSSTMKGAEDVGDSKIVSSSFPDTSKLEEDMRKKHVSTIFSRSFINQFYYHIHKSEPIDECSSFMLLANRLVRYMNVILTTGQGAPLNITILGFSHSFYCKQVCILRPVNLILYQLSNLC